VDQSIKLFANNKGIHIKNVLLYDPKITYDTGPETNI